MAKRPLNLNKMELAELVQLRDEIETALDGKIAMERKELQSKLAELSALESKQAATNREVGKPKTLRSSAANRKPHPQKGIKAKPKYRGPNGETWAGRGMAPKWLTDIEKKGKKREQYLIGK